MRRIGRRLFWLAYGFAPLWLAAILAQYERRGDLTAASERQAAR